MATTADIRKWLEENDYKPGARGRLHPDHLLAWQKAHPEDRQEKPAVAATKAAPTTRVSDDDGVTDGLSREEQETTIAYTAADEKVQVYTCIKRDITKFKKDPNFTLVREGTHGTTAFAYFTIPVDKIRIGSAKTMNLSDEEKARRAKRMSDLHKNK